MDMPIMLRNQTFKAFSIADCIDDVISMKFDCSEKTADIRKMQTTANAGLLMIIRLPS
jgi:hypothetical protein